MPESVIHAYAAKTAKATLEPFDYNPGPLGPHEVEVKVTHCGICHSDVAMIDNDWRWSQYPLVPGHEAIGTISSLGSDVNGLTIGQRVGIGWQNGSCGICEYCRAGKEAYCAKESATIAGHHGGFASHVRVQASFAIAIPEGIPSEYAGPLQCAGTTVFSPMLHYGVKPNWKTAVVGIGGLGHLAVQYLAHMGCQVTAISSTHNKDEEARGFGATNFIATKGTDELKKAADSFDFILSTASGTGLDFPALVAALRPGGTLCLTAPPEATVTVSALSLIGKEKRIVGGRTGSPQDTAKMLEFTARHNIKPMINKFKLADVNAALDHLRAGKARYRVVLEA
jgi:uncharacterized zinc-type alcohol dehydrogenase-like protein